MVLRRLSIYGFKSFADKTELTFGEGMTAVIGPNGCGKSNVVDAIRWVFGEQRASVLRSTNMQEVIFAGTQTRQPLNMAEVTLTIENNKGILPVEYGEVAITRRIFRSGESEYRLNKVPCRLRDIQNIFLDTGVGSSAYTTIEQRMIDRILSDHADERRVLFEEAAGIGKYKHQRKESQSKLDKTRQDLLRINDKVQEAERLVRSLERQMEKAKRFKNYREALTALEVSFENNRYLALSDAIKQRKAFLEETKNELEVLRASKATYESRIETMQLDALEKEKDLEIASRNVSDANARIVEIDRDKSVAEVRLDNLKQTGERLKDEAAALDRQAEKDAAFKTQIELSLVERETQLLGSKERAESVRGELAEFDKRLSAARDVADKLARDRIELVNQIGEAKSRLNSARSSLTNASDQRDRASREIDILEERFEDYGNKIEECRAKIQLVDSANKNYLQSRETLTRRIEHENARYEELLEKEKHLEAQISSNKTLLKSLMGLDAAFEGYESGVKELLKAKLPGLRGIVADLISVSDESLLPVVEKIAGNLVQTVVFDTNEQLDAAVRFLRDEKAGAARMVALERINAECRINNAERVYLGASQWKTNDNIRDMRSLIKTVGGCEALAGHVFGRFAIADDYETAAAAARDIGIGGAVISLDGVICGGDGSVIAGDSKKETAGILARKQQIEKLTADIERFETEHQAICTDRDNCAINRDEAKMALIKVNDEINKGQREHQAQETTINHHENERENISIQIKSNTSELEALSIRISEFQRNIADIEAETATLDSRGSALEEEADAASASVRAMDAERINLANSLNTIQLEVQGFESRIAADKKDINMLTNNIAQLGVRKQAKIDERERCAAEIVTLENKLELMAADLEAAKARREELKAVYESAREEHNGRLSEIEQARKDLKDVTGNLEESGNLVHDAELKQTRDEQERQHTRQKIWEAYEIDLEDAPQENMMVIEDDDETVVANIAKYKERLKHVGDVNMAALHEFETENARLTELTAQRDDLQSAVNELEKAITRLDKEARAQFLSIFEQVQKNFTEMFTTLFEGGEARLTLQEGVDPLEAEIHINVRPTGKKMCRAQTLSGGERALTATSLLFALYLVKPSAYCILDELDGPLDDANIGRFVRVLRKFAEKTQFIIITHNKRTMEATDFLYGVTQQELGVSTIASVKFDDAALWAA